MLLLHRLQFLIKLPLLRQWVAKSVNATSHWEAGTTPWFAELLSLVVCSSEDNIIL
eukprot:c30094_g1_i1 orf=67-234(+)